MTAGEGGSSPDDAGFDDTMVGDVRDPYPEFAVLREHSPVVRHESPYQGVASSSVAYRHADGHRAAARRRGVPSSTPASPEAASDRFRPIDGTVVIHGTTVGVIAHPERDCATVFAGIRDWAAANDMRIVTPADPSPLSRLGEQVPDDVFAASDLLIAVGGDGTILLALAVAAPARLPVLGVNVGRLGFLAEVEPAMLPNALEAITAGDFSIEERFGLAGRIVVDGTSLVTVRASNDLVLGRISGRGQAEFAVSVDGELFARYVGDGPAVPR